MSPNRIDHHNLDSHSILASSNDPGGIQAWIYVTAALLLMAFLPLIARVPEHQGSW